MRIKDASGIEIYKDTVRVGKKGHAQRINFDDIDADIIILAYQPGTGKTHAAMNHMENHPDTFYFTERHETINELIEEYKVKLKHYSHWEGFDRICKRNNIKKRSIEKKIPIRFLCELYNCDKLPICRYFEQFYDRTRVFAPLNFLRREKIRAEPPEMVFIDEGINITEFCKVNNDNLLNLDQELNMPPSYRRAIKNNSYEFFTPSRINKIRKRQRERIREAIDIRDSEILERITRVNISEFNDYIRIGRVYNYDRIRYGIPYHYYAFDMVNNGAKIVFLDATHFEKLFKHVLYSYNGEIGFKKDIRVGIYSTNTTNKETIIYRMHPAQWHPKVNFVLNQKKDNFNYVQETLKWLPNDLNKIRDIFGEKNIGIITFKEIAEQCRKLGFDVEYYKNLRSKNIFKDKPVLIIIGHFFPPQFEEEDSYTKEGNIKKKGLHEEVEKWFLREKDSYHPIDIREFIEKKYKFPSYEAKKNLMDLWKEVFWGKSAPRRHVDQPGKKIIFRKEDPIKLRPVNTIQELFDEEIYQAIHRNRGLKKDRIIFAYCWIPHRFHMPGRITAKNLYKLREEFTIVEIDKVQEPAFFEMLKDRYGDTKLIIKRMIDDIERGKPKSWIAKQYGIMAGPGKGLDSKYAQDIIDKYLALRKMMLEKAKRPKKTS